MPLIAWRGAVLTNRWTQLGPHPEQLRLVRSEARFKVVAAGRRSGKTERAKRHLVRCALAGISGIARPTYAAAAPTRDQAKRIFWQDLKALSPREWISSISESELTITYRTGSQLMVVGLDRPHRIEGVQLDGIVVDEIAEVKRESWEQSIRPALSTRGRPPGWAWFTGRPKGRGHFYELFSRAGTREGWESFTWTSATVVDAAEIEQARADLDPLTFAQEYEAKWVTFAGMAYYTFDAHTHLRPLKYDPNLPLVFCFDFNVDPGVAVILQDQPQLDGATCVLGEVWIPRNSNTPAVCRKLCQDWGHHQGQVHLYGDATGNQRKTSGVQGTDWELIRQHLRGTFADVRDRVQRSNPPERDRVNAMNTRLKNAAGRVSLYVDPRKAPHVVQDLEGVSLLEGGSGEIDKKKHPELTHLTDALGYFVHAKHPIGGHVSAIL